jgi:hypothetical protein
MNYRLLVTAYVIVILLTVVIAAAAAGLPSNMVYATSYQKSQTITQTSECGNYWFPINIICSNLGSQIQGDENSATVSAAANDQEKESSQSFAPFP